MIQKWKTILTNWINCYTSEIDKTNQNITPENLLNILTHIHENFKLDDSKSSKFEAETIQDFIIEKYPEIKFENGTLEAPCEEEIYIVASLLLFFICVNSKNTDIKRIMCSKLSVGDQETIMKFSKCLMNCSPILYADVEAAIKEACGDTPVSVAETPPALRSLHSEVRRLQAALDAERFDRNYLQDELARTNLKLEKLTKIKEQYKLDILSLKAKISLCCGEQRESHREARADEFIGRLHRQLQDLEARLEDTLGKLDDTQQERDTYKKKVDDLKQERDKWLSLSQQEAYRAGQLAEQLDTERRTVASLRDLVSELRQHNRNNGLDSSMLECDDPDTSIHSLSNLSVCNEVCANVIEVQLGEERAKIEVLKQQIRNMQDMEALTTKKHEEDTLIWEKQTNELKEQIQSNLLKIEKLEDDKTVLSKEVETLKALQISEKKDYEENAMRWEKQRIEMEEQIQAYALKMEKLDNKNAILLEEIEAQIKEIQAHKEKALVCQREKHEMKEQVQANVLNVVKLQNEKATLMEEMEAIQLVQKTERKDHEEKTLMWEKQRNEMRGQIHANILKIEKSEYEKDALLKEVDALKAIQVRVTKDYEENAFRWEKEKTEMENKIQANILQLEKLQNEKTSLMKELETVKAARSEEFKVHEQNTLMWEKQKIEMEDLIQLNILKVQKYEDEKTSLMKEIETLKVVQHNENKHHKEKTLMWEKKSNEMTEQLSANCLKIEKLHDEKEVLLNEIKGLKAVQLGLEKDIEQNTLRCERLNIEMEGRLQAYVMKVENLESEKVTLRKQLEEVKAAQSEKTKVHEENARLWQKQKTQMEEQIRGNILKVQILGDEKAILIKEINELRIVQQNGIKEHEEKTRMWEELTNEMREQIQAHIRTSERFKDEKELLLKEMESLKAIHIRETKDYEENMRRCEKQTVEMYEQIQTNIVTVKKLESEKVILVKEVEKLKRDLIREIKTREDNSLLWNKEKHEMEEQIQLYVLKIEKIDHEKMTLMNELEAVKAVQSEEIKAHKENTLMWQKQKLELEAQIQDYNLKVEKLQHEKVTLMKEMEMFKTIQENGTKDHEEKILEWEKQTNEMTKQIQTHILKNEKLEDEKKTLLKEVEELKAMQIREIKVNAERNALMWQELKVEMEERIETNRLNLDKLQAENAILVKELEALKAARSQETKVNEENALLWQRQRVEMEDQLQANVLTLEKLTDEKTTLMKELDVIKVALSEETKIHEEKALQWQTQMIEMEEHMQANVLKVEKLENEKTNLMSEMKTLKIVQQNETKVHEEEMRVIEKLMNETTGQIHTNKLKIKKLEDEKEVLLKEIEAQSKEIKAHEERSLTWEKEKSNMMEQLQAHVQIIEKLENEKANFMKELEAFKFTQTVETQSYEENAHLWREEKKGILEQLQTNFLTIQELKNKNANLINDLEELKIAQIRGNKVNEENALIWEKQKVEMEEQIQINALKVEKLQDENAVFVKELEALKAAQNEEKKAHQENAIMCQEQKIELEHQIQQNSLELKRLEDEKEVLLQEIEELKSTQSKESEIHTEKSLIWKEENSHMIEQLKANVVKIKKLEDENARLIKDTEALKVAHIEEIRFHEENTLRLENEKIEMEDKIQTNALKIEKLEDEKASFEKALKSVKAVEKEKTRAYDENLLTWQQQKIEMEQQMQANALKVVNLEQEKAILTEEIEALRNTQMNETKDHEEKTLMWEKETNELKEQIQARIHMSEKLQDEKEILCKELDNLKTTLKREAQENEQNALRWEKQNNEMEEQIQTNVLKALKLEDEVMLLKEMEVLNIVQREDIADNTLLWEKQINDMRGQIQARDLEVKSLEEEKALLVIELEALKTAEKKKTKEHEEKIVIWEKEKAEMNEQIRAKSLKVVELEDEKAMILKKVGELMAAEMEEEMCVKNNHEGKILALERQESEMKEKIQTYVVRVEELEQEKMILLKEVEALKAAQKEMLALTTQDKIIGPKHTSWEKEIHGAHHQVDTTTSDLAHSSMESLKTISDLEKIVQDKNRKITSMQTEISYFKSMMADSGIKFIDVTKELEVSKDTCQELSSQLKKIVQQKNEEIADLKRQVAKMSATENRASQIIKVSAKYQAMILKRIAEIKSSAVLKELTNFGNQNSSDSELRRSLAGSVTMEDLENFLETTDRHLKRCSEKQIALQKDRDRLSEVNRINESEIINMKKFLTEMSVSFRTFTTVKEVYNQKLSKIVSLQRTVRRDILSLDGRITEATMCKLERGYAAVMQDLSECAMNLERWVDRSISRMLSAEKIKQAFTSDLEQASLSTCNYQNASVEVQLSELENSFQKLLAEIGRAHKGDGARNPQEVTIMEVRAEYEDKLNRMKAKMKELFHEEMARLKQKQSDEIAVLERELIKSRDKMAESSRAYEEHIRALTTELWSVGEKFLVKQEEADWLRRKQSGSLMSLQHVHSSGLHPSHETSGRPSDTFSLRSLPMHNKKTEARGLHMSDEEGEVFDNRFLKELAVTPRASLVPGQRISELKRRNSLVPPHLKSSYPAEMQFAPTLDEEDIKCASTSLSLGRPQRKEVGITAYKKPGPPTPSKQAGRLSATDSELRESLRVEAEPQGRKTSTPSRIRSLFRPNRNDTDVGTPRSRRFSSIFRKK